MTTPPFTTIVGMTQPLTTASRMEQDENRRQEEETKRHEEETMEPLTKRQKICADQSLAQALDEATDKVLPTPSASQRASPYPRAYVASSSFYTSQTPLTPNPSHSHLPSLHLQTYAGAQLNSGSQLSGGEALSGDSSKEIFADAPMKSNLPSRPFFHGHSNLSASLLAPSAVSMNSPVANNALPVVNNALPVTSLPAGTTVMVPLMTPMGCWTWVPAVYHPQPPLVNQPSLVQPPQTLVNAEVSPQPLSFLQAHKARIPYPSGFMLHQGETYCVGDYVQLRAELKEENQQSDHLKEQEPRIARICGFEWKRPRQEKLVWVRDVDQWPPELALASAHADDDMTNLRAIAVADIQAVVLTTFHRPPQTARPTPSPILTHPSPTPPSPNSSQTIRPSRSIQASTRSRRRAKSWTGPEQTPSDRTCLLKTVFIPNINQPTPRVRSLSACFPSHSRPLKDVPSEASVAKELKEVGPEEEERLQAAVMLLGIGRQLM